MVIFLQKKLNIKLLLKYERSPLQKSAVCRTTSSLLFETNQQQIILHVGTNDLKTELTTSQIAESIIDLTISLKNNGNMIAVSGIVTSLDELNNKAAEVNNCLELMSKQRRSSYISHCETIDPNKLLNESNLCLNPYGTGVFTENISFFVSNSN